MKKTHFTASPNEGFLLIPRNQIKKLVLQLNSSISEDMAMLIILYHCNYSDKKEIKRSEALLTLSEWSQLFHWSMSQTRRYINRLIREGELSQRYEGRKRILCVTHYEELCGKYAGHTSARKSEKRKTEPSKTEREFERFWTHYHEVNRNIEPSDKELARKEWGKLSVQERIMAYENAYDFYISMSDLSHAKKAYNYLRHKSFMIG